jgi:hypothetical protein
VDIWRWKIGCVYICPQRMIDRPSRRFGFRQYWAMRKCFFCCQGTLATHRELELQDDYQWHTQSLAYGPYRFALDYPSASWHTSIWAALTLYRSTNAVPLLLPLSARNQDMVGRPGNTLHSVKDSCKVDWMLQAFPRCSTCKVLGSLVKENTVLLWMRLLWKRKMEKDSRKENKRPYK